MTDDVSKQALRDYEGEENRLRSITALLVKELELLKATQREMPLAGASMQRWHKALAYLCL